MKFVRLGTIFVVAISLVIVSANTSRRHGRSIQDNDSCVKRTRSRPRRQFRPKSCLDYLRRGVTKCGYYKIYDNNGGHFPVYCDMKSEPGNAWTLIMSWSTKNRGLAQFKTIVLKYNAPVQENTPNWDMYRLTLDRMNSIKSHSTHWRATCSYPTHGIDYKDYVRGNFKDFDFINYLGSGCKKVEYVNLRGHLGIHTTVVWAQAVNSYMIHIDSSEKKCSFVPAAGAVSSEDNFGFYGSGMNTNFRCNANSQATTQWWIGGHL